MNITEHPLFNPTMKQAATVQSNYEAMGASPTQNMRNPRPMRDIILEVLPRFPSLINLKDVIFKKEINVPFWGEKICLSFKDTMVDNDHATEYIAENAPNIDKLIEKIRQQGYIVNSKQYIRSIINQLKKAKIVEGAWDTEHYRVSREELNNEPLWVVQNEFTY